MTKKIAFIFPGQGSQSVGMLSGFAENAKTQALYTESAKVADQALGENLSGLIAQGPADDLNLTVNTQPALVLASHVAYLAWIQAGGPKPDLVAGHSLGEYSALLAAGGLELKQAIELVRIRAQAMQNAVPVGQGGMAAILGLDDPTVVSLCAHVTEAGSLVEPVNFNAPSQVVVAGTTAGIEALCKLAKEQGAKRALPLSVSAPFHSSLLKPAALVLKEALEKQPVSDFSIPLVTNVDVLNQTSGLAMADSLVRQAHSPVRWVESVQAMADQGVDLFIECGPGKVLAGLVKRICDVPVVNVSSPETLDVALEAL